MGSFKVHPHFRWYVHFKGPKRGLFIYLQPASFIFKPDQKMFKPLAGRRPVAEKGVTLLASVNPYRDSTTHLSSTQHVHSYSLTTAHAAGPSKIGARCVSYVRSIFSSSKCAERP